MFTASMDFACGEDVEALEGGGGRVRKAEEGEEVEGHEGKRYNAKRAGEDKESGEGVKLWGMKSSIIAIARTRGRRISRPE